MNQNMDLQQLWENAQPIIKKSMTAMSYQLWIEGLEPLCVLNDALVFTYTGDMALDTLRNLYTAPVTSAIAETTGAAYRIVFVTSNERDKYLKLKEEESRREETPLNPKFTFDNFVIGGSNNIATAAAKAVADNPATAYNPLFIYGDVGLGKTHLMHAIGNHIKDNHPAYRITYVTSETFTNELIDSIKDNTNAQFRSKYRNVDVLMVDDVQFIAGKNTTQEEFFNTFNSLHTSGKQIIISSDKPPKEIPALEDRLRSRFEGGLITDIQPPDYETRIAILQKKAAQESIVVDEKVLSLIASKVNANIRQLEGAFTRVVAFSRLTGTPVDVKMAETALKDIVDSQERKVTVPLIQQVVAEFYGVTVENLMSPRRTADITYPRQVAMYLSREMTDMSLKNIGQAFGRDYSTVISACKKIEDDLRFDTKLPLVFKDLKKRIRGAQ
ncbi:MAG: chromosomal replication initiator protein DnaA [Clostridia bacterium]|nr:chromosomal replication initiator protein DnaA [Clostridia bacterium]